MPVSQKSIVEKSCILITIDRKCNSTKMLGMIIDMVVLKNKDRIFLLPSQSAIRPVLGRTQS